MSRFSHQYLHLLLKNAREKIIIGHNRSIQTYKVWYTIKVIGVALEEKTVTPVTPVVVYCDNNDIIWTRNIKI